MLWHKFHEDIIMQTRKILLWIHVLFVYCKTQNFSRKYNILPFHAIGPWPYTMYFLSNNGGQYKNAWSLFVCFVALRPKSTAMVIAGRSVHLTTPFSWASLNKQLTSNRAHTFACNWQQPFMNDSAEGRRMTVEIISWSISTKVWDRAGIELATPGSAVSFASVTRHVTDCATRPGNAWSSCSKRR